MLIILENLHRNKQGYAACRGCYTMKLQQAGRDNFSTDHKCQRWRAFLTSNDQKMSIKGVPEASASKLTLENKEGVSQTNKKKIEDRATPRPPPQMEIFISAVMGELVTRSMSSIISKYSKPPAQAVEISLERTLLKVQVIIDEAAGRHITNQGMLRQLRMLRDAMYRGHYVLDTFRCQAYQEDEVKDNQAVNLSWAVSKFGYAQRLVHSSCNSRKTLRGIQEVLDCLRTMILDASEMAMFLTTYPRLYRQPYSMHLLLDKCMFARQMEMELVVDFLLHPQPCHGSSVDRFDVLPIVGPGRVGKSTLVAHVCEDERVRDHFSQIVFFRHGNFRSEDIALLRDKCAARYENNERFLVVVDIIGDLDEDLWERLCFLCQQSTTNGSKIIITSRSDKIAKLGTTQTLTLKHLSYEAYWYFFKVIAFGGTDPELYPRLVYLAMEIARILNGNLVGATMTASLLRANFNIHFWCNVRAFLRGYINNHLSTVGEHPYDLLKEERPTYIRRMGETTEDFVVLDQNQTCSSQEEVPQITLQDVLYGGVKPHGRFKASWKSRIPPYHCYIYTCEIREVQTRVVKRKRSQLSD